MHEVLDELGAVGYPKTSGSKGLQLYARADDFGSAEETSAYAKGLAQRLEKEQPELVVVPGDVNSTLAAALAADRPERPNGA